MECSISTDLIRGLRYSDFTKLIHCLSRFSEDLTLRCSESDVREPLVQLAALNSTRSGFIIFTLASDYFENYILNNEEIAIKIATKALLSVMKLKAQEKNLLGCSLKIDTEISRLVQTTSFTNGAIRTHRLPYASAKLALPSYDPAECANEVVANARVLSDWLDHFTPFSVHNDITLICTETSARFASAGESIRDATRLKDQSTATLVQVDTTEFELYGVRRDAAMNFSMKEFKAIIQLAEGLGAPITLMFSDAPHPLQVVVDADDLRASMILSTSVPSSTPSQVAERSYQTSQRSENRSHIADTSAATNFNADNSHTSNVSNFLQSALPPNSSRKKRRINMESIPQASPIKKNIPEDDNNDENNEEPLFLSQNNDFSIPPPPSQIIGSSARHFDPSMARDGMNEDEMRDVLNDMDLDPNSEDSATQDEADINDDVDIMQHNYDANNIQQNNDSDDNDDDLLETQQNGNFKPLWFD
ncbi:hypothetical protein E3Q23_03648 [Wallemia mellicola]|uniref:Rad9-domain-containing protein n=1 Tax=Wallemia mellicola TaxID=1708541 RepID=A0A4T0LPZ1_9BASI|nr:hypothetical protein E3Q23_03648 [Wallemia mellicola]TIB89591.1 hypothetical protein E3Q19_03044 [Wallemia mellicola]TIB98203.1 hypothetical protein E3Q17_03079 [Wallemia mellicola]TIC09848.1 hypothetical protein E3Q14_03124 [Wallemia mellicola]